eukprot:TRINITY_DN2848_c0_g2_i1.p1 TRINITY_DN2848_c0_g2~~TRINITY_DN2848_c0_g2_i1.p1  ORF type:complete len:1725 (-),score=387.24 TRINITY_DN2848_c0_g2_i1:1884-6590(-)
MMLIDTTVSTSRIYSYMISVHAGPEAATTATEAANNILDDSATKLELAWSCAEATAQKERLQCEPGTLVLASACATFLAHCHSSDDDVQFCKAMLIQHAVALALPLSERCFAVDADPDSEAALAFFNTVCLYSGALVHSHVPCVATRCLYDLVDVRLFNDARHWLKKRQCCVQSELGLGDDINSLLTGSWVVIAAIARELGLQSLKLLPFFDQPAQAPAPLSCLSPAQASLSSSSQHIIRVTHPLLSVCSKADEVFGRYSTAVEDDCVAAVPFAVKPCDSKQERIAHQRVLHDLRAKIRNRLKEKLGDRKRPRELQEMLHAEVEAHRCTQSPAFITESDLLHIMEQHYTLELSDNQLAALRVQCGFLKDKLNWYQFMAFLFKRDKSTQLEARAFERFKISFKVNAVPHKEDVIRCRSDAKGVDFFGAKQLSGASCNSAKSKAQKQQTRKKAPKPGTKAAITSKKEQSGIKQKQLQEEGQTADVARLEKAVCIRKLGTEEATRELFLVLQRKGLLQTLPGILICLKYAFKWAQVTGFPSTAAASATPTTVVCRLCLDAVQLHGADLLPKDALTIKGYLERLGFAPAAQQLCCYYLTVVTAAVTKAELAQLSSCSSSSATLPFSRFQMMYMGPVLHRMFDSAPDSRVSFDPDKWQRDLLTCVDTGKCCLVVAPTSAGKTFISYYAMQRTYEANRKSNRKQLVVYVAPTRALVLQVAAETSNQLGCEVGIYTRDYRKFVDTCDVMVTLPQDFEQLLLSPGWGKRLCYCIFDEVHCINTQTASVGDVSSGLVWENCIKLVPCPYLALSATVGNAAQFHSWLQSVQTAKYQNKSVEYPNAHEVVYICHTHRFVDIETCCYSAEDQLVVDIHPLAVVPSPVAHPQQFVFALNSVPFTPKECCQAYDALRKCVTSAASSNEAISAVLKKVEELEPGTWFPDWRWLTRADVFDYEARLKALAVTIAESRPDVVDSWLATFPFPKVDVTADTEFYDRHLLPLLRALEKNDDLPALFFVLQGGMCDKLAELTFTFLDTREKETGTGLYAPDQKRDESRAREQQRRVEEVACKSEEARRELDESAYEIAPLEKIPLRDGSFAKFVPKDNVWLLKCRGCPDNEKLLVGALQRGIASHHAGLSKHYRQAVEALFREGYIRVIFATGTLALGINVPARSIVFSNNSSFLSPLMFQQMRGRAGRRGLDNIGKCIFANFPIPRTSVLLTSSVPSIQGDTPLNINLVLQTMVAYHECSVEQRQTAAQRFCVASYPPLLTSRCEVPQSVPVEQTLFRLGIDFLVWSHILSPAGEPINFAGLVHHLRRHDAGNFTLVHLLSNGVVQRVCEDFVAHPELTAHNLMHLLCAIFGVIPTPTQRSTLSNSVPVLPPLPGFVSDALEEYYVQALERFKFYCHCQSDTIHLTKADFQLPLSGACFNTDCPTHKPDAAFMQYLHPVAPDWRSMFVSMTGPENLHPVNVTAVACDCRQVAKMDPSFIPVPATVVSCINSYALDFYKNGVLSQIEHVNRLGNSAFDQLYNWRLLLRDCAKGLTNMTQSADMNLTVSAFQYLQQAFQNKLEQGQSWR